MLVRSLASHLSFLTIASASLAMAACSSSSTTTVNDAGKTPVADAGKTSHDSGSASDAHTVKSDAGDLSDAAASACSAQAAATCGTLQRCDPGSLANQYGVLATCVARQTINCGNAFESQNSGNTVAETTACAAATAAETCPQDLDETPPTACATPKGSVQVGGACSHAGNCATAFCAIAPQSSCGTCQSPPVAGASCAALTTCGQGLSCVKDVCVQYVQSTDAGCSVAQPCGSGLSCVGGADAGSGDCLTAGSAVGMACDAKQETAPGCDSALGLYCDTVKSNATYKTCQTVATAMAGMPCGDLDGIPTECVFSTCVASAGDAGKTCVARAADHAACNTVTGPACIAPARCVGTALDGGTSGTCTQPATSCP